MSRGLQYEGSATAAQGGLCVSVDPLLYLASAFLSKMNSLGLLHILQISLQSSVSPCFLCSSTFWEPCLPAFQHPQPCSEPVLCCLLVGALQGSLNPCSRPRELPCIHEVTLEKEVGALLAQTACAH